MPESERGQDAWVSMVIRRDNPFRPTLVAPGTPRSVRAVALDRELLACPRTPGEIRNLSFAIGDPGDPDPSWSTAVYRMAELFRTAPWSRLAELVERR
jgi:hypothetical protein